MTSDDRDGDELEVARAHDQVVVGYWLMAIGMALLVVGGLM